MIAVTMAATTAVVVGAVAVLGDTRAPKASDEVRAKRMNLRRPLQNSGCDPSPPSLARAGREGRNAATRAPR